MSIYTIEECSLYKDSIIVSGIPIYIFDDHNMALPAWGVSCSRLRQPLNLVTFDKHADTHPSFHSYVFDQTGEAADSTHLGLKNPEISVVLKGMHYQPNDLCFEDAFKITVDYLKNDEQILAGVDLGYLSSYTVVTREDNEALGYEHDDRMLGYNATYVVDFDLDFFGAAIDFDEEFIAQITPLIKRAFAITIAKEPYFFESCRTDEHYTNEQALAHLLHCIRNILS